MLLDLDDDVAAIPRRIRDPKRVVDFRKVSGVELHVDDRADDLNDPAGLPCLCSHSSVPHRPGRKRTTRRFKS
jgi:hypothetical protein